MHQSSGAAGRSPPIGDYAIIGNCRTAGLISRSGSLDWLCLPRFDSPSVFGALLDDARGGRFRVRPSANFRTERRYLPDTNLLETTFVTADGTVVLRDAMPVASEEHRQAELCPDHEVLREIAGVDGEVEVEVLYEPRPNYGSLRPRLDHRGNLGLWCENGREALILRSEVPLMLSSDGRSARGTMRVRAGDRAYLSFSYSADAPAVIPALGPAARARLDRTTRWWEDWSGRCPYTGSYRDAVVRSRLVLKLLAYAPSGALIAAPTTSLPEEMGGALNWDYRFCWLRDASFTVRALFALGCHEEAEAFVSWVLQATRLTWPELQVVYDVFGEAHLAERELAHLEGFEGSRPVRIGNAAYDQLQLDVYGEVLDAVGRFTRAGGRLDGDTTRLLNGLGRTVCRRWREPDEGIWEGRSGRFHHTHSKALCWAALDCLIWMHEAGYLRVEADTFRAQRAAIRAEIEARGYNSQLESYTRTLDGDEVDASLLVLPLYGYIVGTDPRMRSTYARIREALGQGSLVYRYRSHRPDGPPIREGAFGICSFWAVECLALGGDVAAATEAFEQLLSYGNDVGLFAEEIDAETGAALGNFPQAFTHVGLVNAALTLAQVRGEHAPEDATGGRGSSSPEGPR